MNTGHLIGDEGGYPLCDIGPLPWGDGIVHVKDLIVLTEHLAEEPPTVELGE